MSLEDGQVWYFSRNGEQFGPNTLAEIKQFYARGKINPGDHVWSPELQDWKPAEAVLGRRPGPPPPPPAAPSALRSAPAQNALPAPVTTTAILAPGLV